MFGEFQRIFKGEAFARCMAPLRVLWEAPEDPMACYHNVFIQFQLESMICSYFEDVGQHRGGYQQLIPRTYAVLSDRLRGCLGAVGK